MRVGIGFDIHRLIASQESAGIPLGGIRVPCQWEVQAHSDGDVLLHALTDACFGALSLGDIGEWFPDSDATNRNRRSTEFVKVALSQLAKRGFRVSQLDSIVYLEKPKLGSYREAIRASLAGLLELEPCRIGVKAKTMEGLGPIGEAKAIAAHVIITVEPNSDDQTHQ